MIGLGDIQCIVCKSMDVKYFFTRFDSHAMSRFRWFSIYRCQSCGLTFISPIPSWDTLLQYYLFYDEIELRSKNSSKNWKKDLPTKFPLVHKLMERGVIIGKGLRLLDVGCGDGGFLQQMQDKGLEVYGVEPDSVKAGICSSKCLNVFCGTLVESNFKQAFFHMITFNQVLEHIPNPHETLDKCRELLAENGTSIIQLPNAHSFLAKIWGRDCQLFAVPYHLFNYSQKSIAQLLIAHGFRITRVRHIPAPFSFVESLSLKSYGKEGQIKGITAIIIACIGLLFELLATIFGRTGVFEVWAKKSA